LTVGRTGSKHHLIVDPSGIPLAVTLTGANRNDVTQLLPLVDGVGPVRGKVGRPRQRAESLIADRGYDHDKYRRELWAPGVKPIHRPALHRARLGSGPDALGRRTHLRLAALLPTAQTSLRTTRRATRSLPSARLRDHLPALPTHSMKQAL
jgi:transposase